MASQVHAEGLQPLLQLHEGGPGATGEGEADSGLWLCWGTDHASRQPQAEPHYSPLLWVQITAAHSNGEEARGAVWGAVAVQKASYIKAKVHGARQVVRVGIHPPDDLSKTRTIIYPGPSGLGATQ